MKQPTMQQEATVIEELAQHAQLKIDTGLAVYFADPHSPWQSSEANEANPMIVDACLASDEARAGGDEVQDTESPRPYPSSKRAGMVGAPRQTDAGMGRRRYPAECCRAQPTRDCRRRSRRRPIPKGAFIDLLYRAASQDPNCSRTRKLSTETSTLHLRVRHRPLSQATACATRAHARAHRSIGRTS